MEPCINEKATVESGFGTPPGPRELLHEIYAGSVLSCCFNTFPDSSKPKLFPNERRHFRCRDCSSEEAFNYSGPGQRFLLPEIHPLRPVSLRHASRYVAGTGQGRNSLMKGTRSGSEHILAEILVPFDVNLVHSDTHFQYTYRMEPKERNSMLLRIIPALETGKYKPRS